MLEHLRNQPGVLPRLPSFRACSFRLTGPFNGRRACAVSRLTLDADLCSHMPPTRFHRFADVLFDFLEVLAAGVTVRVHCVATLASEQLIDRQSGALAEDVPQRHV